jgi:transcriptional regulator with XRE-family HTH domain
MQELIKLRKDRGWSQKQLAKHANVSPATVYELEVGRRPQPRGNTLKKLADALGVKPTQLVGGPPPEEPTNWRQRYLEEQARSMDLFVSVVKNIRELLTNADEWAHLSDEERARCLGLVRELLDHLDEGLRGAADDAHQAVRIETGTAHTSEDTLRKLLREMASA